jgi:hypothetical protein
LNKVKLGLGDAAVWGVYSYVICYTLPFLIGLFPAILFSASGIGLFRGLGKDSEEKKEYREEKIALEYSYNYHTAREILGEE